MNVDARNYSKACIYCRQRKGVPDSKAGLPQRLPENIKFGDIMAFDLVGPFTKTESGNQYVLTMMDMYSRYVEAVPIKKQTANEVAQALFHGWLSRHGISHAILSDRGLHFINNMMSSLLGLLGIEKLNTSAYHPRRRMGDLNDFIDHSLPFYSAY